MAGVNRPQGICVCLDTNYEITCIQLKATGECNRQHLQNENIIFTFIILYILYLLFLFLSIPNINFKKAEAILLTTLFLEKNMAIWNKCMLKEGKEN